MKFITGEDQELRYSLWVVSGHTLSELKYQQLVVNKQQVLAEPCGVQFPQPLEHEQCKGEALALESQRVADHFLQGDDAKEVMSLHKKAVELEKRIRNHLQYALLSSDHSNYICRLCQRLK